MVDLWPISWALAAILAVGTAANAADELRPTCGGVFDLCGYEDASGATVIPRRFEMARGFRHGLAAVRSDGLWGFIDPSGEFAIRPAFLAVGDFHGERAEAASSEGVGVIDREGAFTIPPRFNQAIPFTNDVALVKDRSDIPTRKILWRVGRDDFLDHFDSGGSLRLFHRRNGWLTEQPYHFRWFHRPEHGSGSLIWAKERKRKSSFGLMDESGSWVVEPSFEEVGSLMEGYAGVRRGLWGAVDENGEIVVAPKFHSLSRFRDGYAVIVGPGPYKFRKYGLIRLDGTVLAEPEFDDAVLPREPGELPRVRRDGIWYWFDNGELIPIISTSTPEGTLIASCPQGLRVILRADGYHLTDAEGNPTLKEPVEHVSDVVPVHQGPNSWDTMLFRGLYCRNYVVASIGNYGEPNWRGTFIRTDGRSPFEPPRFFTSLSNFYYDHIMVATGRLGESRKWGVIDRQGHFTVALGPNRIRPEGRASHLAGKAIFSVDVGDDTYFIDAHGNPDPDIEKAVEDYDRQLALKCMGGAMIIGDGERFGIAQRSGEVLVPAIHSAIICYRNGLAWAPDETIGKWCPIGPDGRFRDAPSCQKVHYSVSSHHHYPEPFADDPFESSVLWVRARLRYGLHLRDTPPRMISNMRF